MFRCPGWSAPDFDHPGQRGATVVNQVQYRNIATYVSYTDKSSLAVSLDE